MANIKSAERRTRTTAKANLRNRAIKSEIRTLEKKFKDAVDAGEKEAAGALLKEFTGALDKAALKGAIHKNSANRKKAQISKMFAGVSA